MQKLTTQEETAMQAIWEAGEGNVKFFLEYLDETMPYTTLASIIKNLERKGFVAGRLVGNMYVYNPLITEEAYKQKFITGFVKEYFKNSYKEMVNFFIEQKKLSPKELKEIIALIESGNKK